MTNGPGPAAAADPTDGPAFDLDREAFVALANGDGVGEGGDAGPDAGVDDADRPVVVRTEATLDVETTPLSAYAALAGRVGSDDAGDDGSAAVAPEGESPGERSPYSFLLESAEKTASSDPDGAFRPSTARADRHARFSYVGYDPDAVITVDPEGASVQALSPDAPEAVCDAPGGGENLAADAADGDVLDALRAALPDVRLANVPERDRRGFDGGLVGFLAYDAVYDLWLDEVGVDRPDSRFPDAEFVLTTRTVAFDDREGTVSLVCTPVVDPGDDPGAVYDDLREEAARVQSVLDSADPPETGGFVRRDECAGSREAYEAHVRRAKEHVLDGDIYQGVISRTRELYGEVDPLGFYEAMRAINPSPYMYLLAHDDLTVVGASPETLVSVRGNEVTSNPIAGTCDRGSSPAEDRRLAGEMLADDKERAEHTMLVDLARNDVRRVSAPGSVRVAEFMNVLKYSHVQHIESTVTGELAAEADAFDATRAAFPAGTLSGAPKVRAMEIIDDLEDEPRGLYGGGVGYYSWTGDADVAIVIRTATVEACAARSAASERAGRDDPRAAAPGPQRITVQAGAGLVADSDPAAEYEETEKKMGGVLAALERIEESVPDEAGAADSIDHESISEPEAQR